MSTETIFVSNWIESNGRNGQAPLPIYIYFYFLSRSHESNGTHRASLNWGPLVRIRKDSEFYILFSHVTALGSFLKEESSIMHSGMWEIFQLKLKPVYQKFSFSIFIRYTIPCSPRIASISMYRLSWGWGYPSSHQSR